MDNRSTYANPARAGGFGPAAWVWAGFGLALAFLAAHTIYVVVIGADVAYMDSLRYIGYYFERPWDAHAWARFWNQGDHRGLLSQWVLWLNIRALGMNILVANVLTGFVLLGTALVLFAHYLRFARVQEFPWSALRRLVVLLAVLAILFSLAGFELYTLDLGFPENLRNGVFLALGCWLLQRNRHLGGGGCALLALALLLVMLFCAYGRIYAFAGALIVAATLAAWRGEWAAGRGALVCTFAATLAATVAYVLLGALLPQGLGSTGLLHNIPASGLVRGVLVGVASSFVGVDAVEHFSIPLWVLGCAGLLLIGLLLWRGLSYLGTVHGVGSTVPVFLIAYGSINVVAVAISRGAEPLGVMASRYYPDFCWLLLGLVWILAAQSDRMASMGRRWRARWVMVAGLLPVLVGYGFTQAIEAVIWPYRVASFDAMRQATLACEDAPESSVVLLQANNRDILQRAVDLQRQYRLGVWRHAALSCAD